MAGITIVKTGNSFVVDFGVYVSSDLINTVKQSYFIDDIIEIGLITDLSNVFVMMRDSDGLPMWYVTYDSTYIGADYFIIDSIDGIAPTSQLDLFNKLTALRG